MSDWIVGLKKAAIEHRPGVEPAAWAAAEAEAGDGAPEELRALYAEMNGATFASGVVLFPLRGQGDVKGMAEQNRSGTAGLPSEDVWRFGRRDQEHLAAVRKRRLSEVEQASENAPPDWLEDEPDERWVFVARDEAHDRLKVYRSLRQLLAARVPPAESEEFGEPTFARARTLVEAAVTELGGSTARGIAAMARALGVEEVGGAEDNGSKAGRTKRPGPAARLSSGAAKQSTGGAKSGGTTKRSAGAAKKAVGAAKKSASAAKRGGSAKKSAGATKRSAGAARRGGSAKKSAGATKRSAGAARRGGSAKKSAGATKRSAGAAKKSAGPPKRGGSPKRYAGAAKKSAGATKRSAGAAKKSAGAPTRGGSTKRSADAAKKSAGATKRSADAPKRGGSTKRYAGTAKKSAASRKRSTGAAKRGGR